MPPYGRLAASLISAAALFAAVPTTACTVWRTPQEKLKSMYAEGAFSGVAAVTILGARYTREPMADTHLWSATATIDSMLMGSYAEKSVTIERGGGSAACEDIQDGNALPKPGDKWIVYFWTSPYRGQVVWITYPANVAVGADPALRLIMKSSQSIRRN